MSENAACVFCRILEGHEKASFVAQGSDAVAFLDLHPINEGHTLVVPRKHTTSISEVDEVAAVAMWSLARRIQPSGDIRPLVDRLAARHGGLALCCPIAPYAASRIANGCVRSSSPSLTSTSS